MKHLLLIPLLWPVSYSYAADIAFTSDATITTSNTYDRVDIYDTPPDQTTVTMTGGNVTTLVVHDESRLERLNGEVQFLRADSMSTANIHDGFTIGLSTTDRSTLNLYGGYIGLYLVALNSSTANVYGGTNEGGITAEHTSTVNLYGGHTDELIYAYDSAVINVFGTDFAYNPTGAPGGLPSLTGYWLDGAPFSLRFIDEDAFSHVNLVPEPTTAIFLITCAVPFLRRRQ